MTILKTAVLQARRSRERRLHCQSYKFPTFLKTFDDKSPKVGTQGLKQLREKSVGGGWARFKALKRRANGRNIVGQQLPTLLDVACCVLRLFAYPVGSCFAKFETGHTFQDFCCSVRSPKRSATMYVLGFNFILGLNFIFFCFWVWLCMIMSLKQKKVKFKPRIKLNHNLCFCRALPMLLGPRTRITSGLLSHGYFYFPDALQVLTLFGVVGFV